MTAATPTSSGGTVVSWSVSPTLPAGLSIDTSTGVISGTPTEATDNITYTLFANVSADGFTSSWSFNMQVLEDTDGDGMPNELPDDYPTTGEVPFDLVEDLDDDGDGASDEAETGTGIYVDGNDMGTDSLDPDTDDDGICDGPNSVPPVCIGGPDANPFGTGSDAPVVLVNNTEMTYAIVSESEADLAAKKISASSPIGKGLMGKVVNDVVDITVPNGIIKFKILNISI